MAPQAVSTGSGLTGPTGDAAGQPCDRMARCRACTVRQNALFVGLTLEELDEIAPAVPSFTLPAGAILYNAEDRPNALFIVRRGVVKQEQYLLGGNYRIVRLARRTDILGLESLLDNPCDHTSVALTEVEVCRVPLPIVRIVMKKQDWLATQMIRHWHHAVQRADEWLTQYSTGGGRQRMARLLVDLHDWAMEDQPSAPLIELPCRDDMGAILGITKETASRHIAEFRRAGLLSNIDGRHVRIDRLSLENVSSAET